MKGTRSREGSPAHGSIVIWTSVGHERHGCKGTEVYLYHDKHLDQPSLANIAGDVAIVSADPHRSPPTRFSFSDSPQYHALPPCRHRQDDKSFLARIWPDVFRFLKNETPMAVALWEMRSIMIRRQYVLLKL